MAVYDINGNIVATDYVSDETKQFKDIASLIQLYSQGSGTVQGVCTDGENLYFGYSSKSSITKYNILTKEATTKDYTSGLMDHMNDLTYNPKTGKIYVVVMAEGKINVVNAETLEYEETIITKDSNNNVILTYGLAYDRKNNRYITADSGTKGKNYSFFDANFTYIKTLTITRTESYTIQGIETDGEYIYHALWDDANNLNYIYVRDIDTAELVKIISVPDSHELEAITSDWDGNWYISYNISGGGGTLYYCSFLKNVEFGTIEQVHKILDAYNA